MPSPAHRIIAKFGGVRALAAVLGHRNPSTVQGWAARALIPARHHQPLLTLARATKVQLAPADFFDAPEAVR